jgi:hypothetical protein
MNRIVQANAPKFAFKTQIVAQAYGYWRSKCPDGRLPARRDLKLEEMKELLSFVFFVDVTGDPLSFRYRLVGTQFYQWTGREYTGVALNEAEYGPKWRNVYNDYLAAVRGRVPVLSEYVAAPWPGREYLSYERIVAPLSDDGTAVNMLFGALQVIGRSAA